MFKITDRGKFQYKHTMYACFTGYIVQAVVNSFVPLLFLTFQDQYGISLNEIAFLTGLNFAVQLIVDLLSANFADKIGYRPCIVAAHIFASAGLILLTILPEILPNAYSGLVISVTVYAVGGGLIEVLISPIMQACPGGEKEKDMSLLHSFYSWGQAGVVLFSSLFFACFGIANWRILSRIWAVIPILNGIFFLYVPIGSLIPEGEEGYSIRKLGSIPVFWDFLLMIMCAGACEQAVSQWASAYAESALHVTKTVGDLSGPLLFALMMGISRLFYGKFGDKIDLKKYMWISGILCFCSYLLIGFSPLPVIGFLGCALCGFSVGILWPGTYSLGAKMIPMGGTAMFAFFAMFGDIGCSLGPTFVGLLANLMGGRLNYGILIGSVFPIVMAGSLFLEGRHHISE